VDSALLRPGRLDRLIYVTPPCADARKEIFEIHLDGKPLDNKVDLKELARMTDGYVGSDIEAICREASIMALREKITPGMDREEAKKIKDSIVITMDNFDSAMTRVKPTSSSGKLQDYEKLASEFARYATVGSKDETEEKYKIYA
jgi:transitional endoplasmic reticulum ATPase